jgi:RecB family exonuclease
LSGHDEVVVRGSPKAVLAVLILELPEIRAASPTLSETMRACLLRAGLSKAIGVSNFVLGNPKAWLGTAYHEVLEKIVSIDPEQEPLENAVERLWNEAIAVQVQHASTHALDVRFGLPATWPGYHVARASVFLRAQELDRAPTSTGPPLTKQSRSTTLREQTFTAFDGRLLGRPDVIRARDVIDYKTGAILEHDTSAETDVVKAGYVRQLRIYGYLVRQNLGWWPERGVLIPLGGAQVEVALDPSECQAEARDAVARLDEYNDKVRAGAPLEDLASPSIQTCRWCAYKIICPVFWDTATPEWSGHLDGAALQGPLTHAPLPVHDGAARALTVAVERGSEARQQTQIAPLNIATYQGVDTAVIGDRVRLVGLRKRADGVLVPSARTVLFRVSDLPHVISPHA